MARKAKQTAAASAAPVAPIAPVTIAPPAEVKVGPYLIRDGAMKYGAFDMTPSLTALQEQPLTSEQLVALAQRLKPLAITRRQLTPRSQLVLKLALGEITAAGLESS